MNLTKLFETQKVLMDRIDYKEPDRFDKTVLALLVEVGECANEWRGFKYWSKNQNSAKKLHTTQGATPENAVYFKCMSEDDCGEYSYNEDFSSLLGEPDYEVCPKCHEGFVYPFREKNPLLEEYVDGLHFVLQLGIELKVEKYITFGKYKVTEIEGQFIEVCSDVCSLKNAVDADWTVDEIFDEYENVFMGYIGLGEMLGFKWKQIEQGYMDKNAVNHARQDSGY